MKGRLKMKTKKKEKEFYYGKEEGRFKEIFLRNKTKIYYLL